MCIARNFIWTTLKAIFSIFGFFAPSDFLFSNSCISAKYCPIKPCINGKLIYSAFRLCINLNLKKSTLMTGFKYHFRFVISVIKKKCHVYLRRREYGPQRRILTARHRTSVSLTSMEERKWRTHSLRTAEKTHSTGWRPSGSSSMIWVRTWILNLL